MQPIYCYTDYRAYLRDAYAQAKQRLPVFSYRYVAKKAGFTSPNFLKLVIEGQRNLTADSIARFAKVFGLKRKERRFFEMLVQFNQAKDPEAQRHYYEQLLEFPEFCQAQELAQEQYEYLSQWYYPVIQELAVLPDFDESPAWIVRRLKRGIRETQARHAIECLCRLGLLQRDADGVLTPASQHVTTGDTPRAATAFQYHQQMIDLAKAALRTQPSAQREYGALTIAIAPRQLALLKNAIRDFRRVVLNLASPASNEKPSAIYQLNIQLFGHTDFSPMGKKENDHEA